MRSTAAVLLPPCLAMALAGTPPLRAAPPTEAYLAYVRAARKAAALEDLFPHLSKAYCAMLRSRPKQDRALWLERLKESVDLDELRITQETVSGRTCTLEGTAKRRGGPPLRGKVSLVLEAGGWKLDEQFWST